MGDCKLINGVLHSIPNSAEEWENALPFHIIKSDRTISDCGHVARLAKYVSSKQRIPAQFIRLRKPSEKAISVILMGSDWDEFWENRPENCYLKFNVGAIRNLKRTVEPLIQSIEGDDELNDEQCENIWNSKSDIELRFNVLPSPTINNPKHSSIFTFLNDRIIDANLFPEYEDTIRYLLFSISNPFGKDNVRIDDWNYS